MAGHSGCLGVLRQLVRIMLSQSDDSCEKELVSWRNQCERKVLEEKNRVKRDLSVCFCEFSNMQMSKSQKFRSDQRCPVWPVRYVLNKFHAYNNIYISNSVLM